MPIFNRNFIKGLMNKDLDERLLPPGVNRHSENVIIVHSEGSDVGSVQNSYSNKKLTNYNFGENAKCLLGFEDEFLDKLYWFVKSDTGCYLVEWDGKNEILSVVLGDTRPEETRVLKLSDKHLITAIDKVVTDDVNKSLLVWSDDNMQPCCINVERAKKYGINGFEKEDIYLIKKPPRFAPTIIPVLHNTLSNNLEEKFLSFCYRFKYLDGEYSALSDYTNYKFTPNEFKLDYFTLDNIGMVNKYNAVKISFNTGDKRVTDIQIVVKESNSNNQYIIETFSKEKEGWGNNQVKSHIFSNNKTYKILPEEELYRSFDNVPLKAKALTIIGNRIVFGNYVEGYNMVDSDGNKIVIDYSLSLINENISQALGFSVEITFPNVFELTNPDNHFFKSGMTFNFYLNVLLDNQDIYSNDFSFILENDFNDLEEFINSEEFEIFFTIIKADFLSNYNSNQAYDVPDGWEVSIETDLTYEIISGIPTFTVTPITFIDTFNSNEEHVVNTSFGVLTSADINVSSNSTSCKTNMDYEIGFVYEEEFNRKSTVITAPYNTIFIPQKYSIFKNKIRVFVNHKAPYWADRFKIAVKAKPLQYQTIYINEFYNEDFNVWCRLVAENKDKVNVGDELIIKVASGEIINNPIKIKVLEIKEHEKDFIKDNKDDLGNDIIEPAGMYMKINPVGFSMDYSDYKIYQDKKRDSARKGSYPYVYLDLFSRVIDNPDPTPDTIEEVPIPSGSEIYINFVSKFNYDKGWRSIVYEKTFYALRDYDNIEEWFLENIIGKNLYAEDNFDEIKNYKDNVELKRGYLTKNSFNISIFTEDPAGKLYLYVKGLESGGSGGRKGYLNAQIRVRTNLGIYVFETNPKQAETQIFYETEQAFEIVAGNHTGNNQNQNTSTFTPAIIDLDFFNCYTQGNGVESYKVKDGFNKDYLNIDLRPSATSIEEYKEIRRSSDLTYSDPFVESTNVNELNSFNISKANYKELDKQYGSIQKLLSRDGDIVVLQEEKASKVMFERDEIANANGTTNIIAIDNVLGRQIFYLGDNGISKNPESCSVNNYQIFYANSRRGVMQRLSIDGVTDIVNGMTDYFRDLFILKPLAKKIGGFDPYHKQYFISIDEEPIRTYNIECGNSIMKNNVSNSFSYNFNINNLVGDIVLNYNITSGNATITALYDGDVFVASNVNGVGNITIPRTDISQNVVAITITPVGGAISFEIANICPLGIPMKVVSIILNDTIDIDSSMINRYRWSGSPFYSENDIFSDSPITRFSEEIGVEGYGRFPNRGTVVNLQTYKNAASTGSFKLSECNRLGYLVTNSIYTESDINTILASATFISISETIDGFSNETNSGNFLFNRTSEDEILYLIWDYTNRKPIASNDYTSTPKGTSKNIVVLGNDSDPEELSLTVTIISGPTNGTAVVEGNNSITYTHNNTNTYTDTITYIVNNGICDSLPATINIDIAVACDDTFTYNGNQGTFTLPISYGTEVGECGISYNAFDIADKFEIFWNGNLVATTGGNVSGSGTLVFNKTAALPTTATIVVTATSEGTAWNIAGICPI